MPTFASTLDVLVTKPSPITAARIQALRDAADVDGFVEPNLWTGIGRARSGCGAAIVGDPAQVAAKLAQYRFDHAAHRLFVGDVGGQGERADAGLLQLPHPFLHRL